MPTFRHGRGTRLLFSNHELSTYFRDANVTSSADVAETTAFLSSVKTYVIGMTDGRLSLGGMFSGDVDGVDEVLNGVFGSEDASVVTYAPEGLDIGRRVWSMMALETSYNVSGSVAAIVAVSAEFQGTGGVRSGFSLLSPDAAIAVTANQTFVDDGADSDGGANVNVHVLENDDTAAEILIQHATSSGGTYTTIASFILTDSEVGGFQVVIDAGTTINQFIRARVVVADGEITAHANLTRFASAS